MHTIKVLYCLCCQVLLQGLQHLNRAVYQDVVAVQLLPRDQWVAPSSVVLQDEGAAKDDDAEEGEEEKAVSFDLFCLFSRDIFAGSIQHVWRYAKKRTSIF